MHVCVNADDMGYLRYRWAKNVNTATSWGEYQTTTEAISGETSDTLHITADKTTTYKCTVSDMISGSKTVMFNVHVSGLIAYPEGADEVDGEPSNRVVVACEAGGVKTLTSPSAGKLKVTYGKCEGCYGYVVRYGKKSDMSDSKTLAVKGANTLTKTLSVEKGKTYYVQVRTYMLVNGVRYFSTYSRIKSVKVK